MAAPSTPISIGKTRNQSRNMFRHPPVMTAASARWGSPSIRRKDARKSGTTITGKKRMIQIPYSEATGRISSFAPKKTKISRYRKRRRIQVRAVMRAHRTREAQK